MLYLIKFDQRDFILIVHASPNTLLLLWHHVIKCYFSRSPGMLVYIVCGYLHSYNRKFTKLLNFFFQCFVNLAGFVLICKTGSNLSLTWQGRVWHFSVQTVCCLICAVLTLLFCSFSWCNYSFSWCNCCFAYLVGKLDMRENQAVCLANLHWLPPVAKAAAGIFEVKAVGNK